MAYQYLIRSVAPDLMNKENEMFDLTIRFKWKKRKLIEVRIRF